MLVSEVCPLEAPVNWRPPVLVGSSPWVSQTGDVCPVLVMLDTHNL